MLFVYNMYLQICNFADKNTDRPNMLLLVSSTLLFALVTSVSCLFPQVLKLEPSSHHFATPSGGFSGPLGSTKPWWIWRVGSL